MAFRTQQRNSSADSSQEQLDNDSSMEMHSPAPVGSVLRRRLDFISPYSDEPRSQEKNNNNQHNNNNHSNINNNNNNSNHNKKPSVSPPYRKVRALRLFDTPATPKTILQKSSANHLSAAAAAATAATATQQLNERTQLFKPAGRDSLPLHNRAINNVLHQQTANVNPFTPDSQMAHNKKRCRTQFGREHVCNRTLPSYLTVNDICEEFKYEELHQAPKRLALQDTNISRYQKEFLEISLIGIGEFGLVFQCLNRLDGCIYAIKKSIKPVAGSSFEKRALNEVWAHAVLGKHDNVVRYYSAWAEDNHMLIQNEYCNGGSLQSLIQKRSLAESELRILLLHVAEGLRYIHSNDLVHMDLKAGNVFLTKEIPAAHKFVSGSSLIEQRDFCDDGMESIYDELSNAECIITYKIGDLGHVTSVKDPYVEEGDCRYLPNEILQEDYSQLLKADIFSLGITLYEAAGGGPLPKNGPEWHQLRNGNVPNIPSLSKEFNDLIRQMTHPDPEKRPSSTSIFNHPILGTMESKTKSQLTQELAIERQKNEILLKKLCEANKIIRAHENKEKGK